MLQLTLEDFAAKLVEIRVGEMGGVVRGRVNKMQQAEHIDRAQKANSEQAVEPRYLFRRTNPAGPQVEAVAFIRHFWHGFFCVRIPNPNGISKQHVRKLEHNERLS